MDKVGMLARDLKEAMKPMVAMIVAEINPVKDQISTREAWRIYGRMWINKHIAKGNLVVMPLGNRNFISRADIETLLLAEKEAAAKLV